MLKVTKDIVRRAGITMELLKNAPLENMPEMKDPKEVGEALRKQAILLFEAITTAYIAQRIILDDLGIPEEKFVEMAEKRMIDILEDAARLNVEKELMKIMNQTLLN